jgi:hypothetical protein
MLINNTTDHIILIPLDDSGRQVRPVVMGWSAISDAAWKIAIFDSGDIEEGGHVSEKGAGNKNIERPKTLADFSQSEVARMSKHMYDVKAMRAWLEGNEDAAQETRESVRVLLQERIKFMTDRSPAGAVDAEGKEK